MQKRNPIVNIPLVTGIALSVSVHVAALYTRNAHTPAKPQLEAGRTVVQLTLVPSIAAKSIEPEPVIKPKTEPIIEPRSAPVVAPIPVVIPLPVPEPSVEPAVVPKKEPIQEPTPKPVVEEATEQIASIIEDKGVVTQASPVVGIRATYPRSSQRRGHQGTVILSIHVLKNGKAGNVTIISSSGFQRLDEAALKAARIADYTPAEQFGKPVKSQLTQPVTFELTR